MDIETKSDDSGGLRVRWWLLGAVAVSLGLLWSCSSTRYVTQSLSGGAQVLLQREPIHRVLQRPGLDPEVGRKLQLVLDVRAFAEAELDLPAGRSYGSYVELDRPYVSWNVVAAPRLSVTPVTWCFPIAGCVSYRGYFKEQRAVRFAERLAAEGMDVSVGGVTAYSTLGWFADPVLSTFLPLGDVALAGLLFHELAHRRFYLPGDTAFNESFASAVELVGERRWIEQLATKDPEAAVAMRDEALELKRREATFLQLVLAAQQCLREVYSSTLSAESKEQAKTAEFEHLRQRYAEVRREWVQAAPEAPVYDGWFNRELNNAHVAAVGDYSIWLDAFLELQRDTPTMEAFYTRVEALADLSPTKREAALRALAPPPADQRGARCASSEG